MKINEVKIKNFRSYRGTTNFDFRFKGDKNIILIGGENGAGKSSIFEAMKICLYGPLTFRYQGMVTNYISKIKSMINEDVYSEENINSYIEINIDMTNGTMEDNYKVRREWSFEGTKLLEKFSVIENDVLLDEEKSNDFYEFFKSSIPPAIFDLSFFDGEKLFDFFEDRISGKKLKETMLTLNNFNIFNILSRELVLNTRRKNREKKNLRKEIVELEAIEKILFNKRKAFKDKKKKIKRLISKINKLEIGINKKNKEFINAGGLNQKDRDRLVQEISKYESERDNLNTKIKSFSNEILPFIIVKDELSEIEEQLYKEQEFIAYETIKDKVDIGEIEEDLLKKGLDTKNLNVLVNEIINNILPNNFNDFQPIYFLSKEQSSKVISKISEITDIDSSDINYFREIEILTEKIAKNRKKLRNSMDMNDEKKYLKEIENMNKNLNEKYIELEKSKTRKEELEIEIEKEEKNLIRINEKIDLIKKAENIEDMSDSIIKMTDDLLGQITLSKRDSVSKYFNEIFSKIIRKNKFIDYIDIDDNFEVSLYVKKRYKVGEIIQMILNLGLTELKEKVGYKFLDELTENKKTVSKKSILNRLNKFDDKKTIKLSTKVDIMNLSSGEKQIYILCLYWALIKSSNINIPFIIDTPYARIDEKHRKTITTEFLPNISHQVIILSTNTEIEEGLYKEINKFVSKEYTLDYQTESRETKVNEGYFYEVI